MKLITAALIAAFFSFWLIVYPIVHVFNKWKNTEAENVLENRATAEYKAGDFHVTEFFTTNAVFCVTIRRSTNSASLSCDWSANRLTAQFKRARR